MQNHSVFKPVFSNNCFCIKWLWKRIFLLCFCIFIFENMAQMISHQLWLQKEPLQMKKGNIQNKIKNQRVKMSGTRNNWKFWSGILVFWFFWFNLIIYFAKFLLMQNHQETVLDSSCIDAKPNHQKNRLQKSKTPSFPTPNFRILTIWIPFFPKFGSIIIYCERCSFKSKLMQNHLCCWNH